MNSLGNMKKKFESIDRKNLKSFSDIKKVFVGVPLGHNIKINNVDLVINGMKGSNYIIKVVNDGTIKDDKGKSYEVDAGQVLLVSPDGLNIVFEKDNRNYSSFDKSKGKLKALIDNIKIDDIKGRKEFVDYIKSCAELVTNDLPPSRKNWK